MAMAHNPAASDKEASVCAKAVSKTWRPLLELEQTRHVVVGKTAPYVPTEMYH